MLPLLPQPSPPPTRQDGWDLSSVEKGLGDGSVRKTDVISYLQSHASLSWLQLWKLDQQMGSHEMQAWSKKQTLAAFRDFVQSRMQGEEGGSDEAGPGDAIGGRPPPLNLSAFDAEANEELSEEDALTQDSLALVRSLYDMVFNTPHNSGRVQLVEDERRLMVDKQAFTSQKLTNKLRQQMADPLVLASDAMPEWCETLTSSCPVLFPFEARQLFFSCTAFGVSRAIAWIQDKQDDVRNPGRAARASVGDSTTEYRVGRLTHERIFVPRGDQVRLRWWWGGGGGGGGREMTVKENREKGRGDRGKRERKRSDL